MSKPHKDPVIIFMFLAWAACIGIIAWLAIHDRIGWPF